MLRVARKLKLGVNLRSPLIFTICRHFSESSAYANVSSDLLALLDPNWTKDIKLNVSTAQPMTPINQRATPAKLKEIEETAHLLYKFAISDVHPTDLVDERKILMALPAKIDDFFFDRPRTIDNYNLLVRVQAARGQIQDGMSVWADMKNRGVAPDERIFAGLLMLCSSNPFASKEANTTFKNQALKLFAEMTTFGVPASVYAHGALVTTLCRLGFTADAMTVFERMKAHGPAPNHVVYTTLMNAYTRTGEVHKVHELFSDMQLADGVKMDGVAYNQAIRACVELGAAEKACMYRDEMDQLGLRPSLYTYSNLILACGQRRDYYLECFKLFDQLVVQGFVPNLFIFAGILNACARFGDLGNARLIFRHMQKYNIKKNEYIYNIMLKVFAAAASEESVKFEGKSWTREERIELAHDYLYEMETLSLKPTVINSMIT